MNQEIFKNEIELIKKGLFKEFSYTPPTQGQVTIVDYQKRLHVAEAFGRTVNERYPTGLSEENIKYAHEVAHNLINYGL